MSVLRFLVDFARTGGVGPARCGVRLDDVIEAWGPPWAEGSSLGSDGRPYLYAYGGVEIGTCQSFCRRVEGIVVQTDTPTLEMPAPEPVPATQSLAGGPTYGEVLDALAAGGCRWEDFAPLTCEDQRALRVIPSGVIFVFDVPEDGNPTLASASVSDTGHMCGCLATEH
ncbi:hypothetical protein ACSNOH_03835 [Streptomyces sp. URMC 127]|uniref:hypothetical protein n=1 Tax=Streptomyces sp. URMC 127 TaxID=3423402 RepID=UPI003F1B89CE